MEHKKDLKEHVELLKVWGKDADEIIKEAIKAQKDVSSKAYNEMQKDRKCEKGSCLNRKDATHRKNGMKHEHCHGGQFNGVSCRQQMSAATQFCSDWLELAFDVWSCEQTDITEAKIYDQFGKHENLLGKLDVTCSTVRGVEGLLPTEAEVLQLEKVILDAKALWIECGFNIKGIQNAI
jgi:hypothetical protein